MFLNKNRLKFRSYLGKAEVLTFLQLVSWVGESLALHRDLTLGGYLESRFPPLWGGTLIYKCLEFLILKSDRNDL